PLQADRRIHRFRSLRVQSQRMDPGSARHVQTLRRLRAAAEPPSFVAGGKQANFDRIEWNIITDAATSSAAIQSGEEDWWQTPTVDLLGLLRKARGVVVERLDDFGVVGCMRFNMLHPPFDNVKLRRALLPAINQADFMNAAM